MKYIITYRKEIMARGRDNLPYRQRPLTYRGIEFNRDKGKDIGFKPSHEEIDQAVQEFIAKGGSIKKEEHGENPELSFEENPLSPDDIQNILEEFKI